MKVRACVGAFAFCYSTMQLWSVAEHIIPYQVIMLMACPFYYAEVPLLLFLFSHSTSPLNKIDKWILTLKNKNKKWGPDGLRKEGKSKNSSTSWKSVWWAGRAIWSIPIFIFLFFILWDLDVLKEKLFIYLVVGQKLRGRAVIWIDAKRRWDKGNRILTRGVSSW